MEVRKYFIVLPFILAVSALADERVIFDAPKPAEQPQAAEAAMEEIRIIRGLCDGQPKIILRAVDLAGRKCVMNSVGDPVSTTIVISGSEARQRQNVLNEANLSQKSLVRRALELMEAKGAFPSGSIEGTPGLPTPTNTPVPTPSPVLPVGP
jgi:hypothetical protein